jgi:phosphoglycerol transferase MdoB-like AlkP superfamily enzyme
MPRKLKIILWVAIGLSASLPAVIMVGYWRAMSAAAMGGPAYNPFIVTVKGTPLPWFMIIFGLIFACGIPIVYWTKKTITQVPLKRYLLLAGASALGILFFQVAVHPFNEGAMVMVIPVCPAALIVGAVLALRFKSTGAG